jgi:multiple antibiotic resistance protein
MHPDFTNTVLLIVAGLFPIINPPASGFIVLSLVPEATPAQLALLARRIAINGFFILVTSLSVGAYVLSFFGISIPILRVAGGVIVAIAGWDLLKSPSGGKPKQQSAASDDVPGASLDSKAFYPLTLPITVGPGSIAVAVALGTESPREGLSLMHLLGVGVALLLLCGSIYLCVRFAGNVEKLLGAVGTEISMRLFAFILFCIGFQIVWLGLSELLQTLHLH